MKDILITILLISIISCASNSEKKESVEFINVKKGLILKKKFLDRPTYKLEYPYKWYIDSTDSDFDIDTYFSLDSPTEGAFTKFIFFNTTIDEKEHLSEQIKEHLKVTIKKGTVTYFDNWGKYNGHGASIKGKFLGVFKGELKLFIHSTDSSSFLIFSQLLDDDKSSDEEGLRIIESSFQFK